MDRNGGKAAWEKNRLGPYTVLRRHAGGTAGDGRLYTAVRGTEEVPVLLVAPGAVGHFLPRAEWSLRASASTKPGFIALELVRAPDCRAPLSEVAEGLDVLANALESLERDADGCAHLLGSPVIRRRSPPRAHNRQHAAWTMGLTAALALALWPRVVDRAPDMAQEEMVTSEARAAVAEAAVEVPVLGLPRVSGVAVALDMPKRPFEGQHRAPCKADVEVELRTRDGTKACWFEVKVGAGKCRENGYEHDGKCYLPSMSLPRRPAADKP
jgi:hypothetical protein